LYDAGLGYSLTHNSNITRASESTGCVNPPCAEWTEQLFGGFSYEERSAALNARLVAQAEKRRFIRNVYRDDTGFFLDGAAIWTILPRQFTWSFEDSFREVPVDLSAPDTPANRSKVNSLATGPDFALRLNPTNVSTVGIRYGRYLIQDAGSNLQGVGDNERYTAYARWLRQISTLTTASLNFETTRVYFDPPAQFTGLFRQDLFFRYELVLPYNRQTIDIGGTRFAQNGGQDLNRKLVRYFGQLSPTADSALRATLYDQISDTYTDMIRSVTSLTIPAMPTTQADAAAFSVPLNVAAGDLYRSQGGELVYVDLGGLFGYSLQGYVRRVDFANVPQDSREKGGRVSATLLFSVQAQAYAFTQYTRRTLSISNEQDTDRNTGLGVIYKLGSSLTAAVEAGQTERQSTVPTASFVDRRAMLLLGYSTGPLYSARPRR
jgi:hypothetical protein